MPAIVCGTGQVQPLVLPSLPSEYWLLPSGVSAHGSWTSRGKDVRESRLMSKGTGVYFLVECSVGVAEVSCVR